MSEDQIGTEISNNTNDIRMLTPQAIYHSYLRTINQIAFTSREIDIISCLIRGKRASRIASLLSIAVKNVENRIAGIKSKLTCGSQDSIIEFIEKAKKMKFSADTTTVCAFK